MEKSELSTRDRMCSVAGGMAGLLVDREIPSRLIPFSRGISPAGYDRGETVSGGDLLDDVD